MAKAIVGASLIAGAAVATYFTGGIASPLLHAAVSSAIAMGFSTGISMTAAAISQTLSDQRGMGITTRMAAGMRQIVYGQQRIGGVPVYESTTGSNKTYDMIIVLASHVLDGMVNIYLDGRQVPFRQVKSSSGYHSNIGCGTVSDPPKTTVNINGGVITSITASTLGSGFASVAPMDGYRVRIYDPKGTGSGAVAWAYLSGSSWTVTVEKGGTGYSSSTIADIQGAFTFGGSGAASIQTPWSTATATVSSGLVSAVTVGSQSFVSGHVYPLNCCPLVHFSGGGGWGAKAHCVMSGGKIASIVVDDGGQDYTSAPDVTIDQGKTGVKQDDYAIGPGGQHYNFKQRCFVEARFGDQPEDDYMKSFTGDSTWAPTAKGTPSLSGCAYIYLNLVYNTEQFPTMPEIRVTVNGKPIYDPRTGKTEISANWALQVADVIRDKAFGLGDDSVNEAQWIAAANICDEQIETSQGLEANYAQHIHYDTSVSPGDALALMMPSAAGKLSRIGGEWYIWPAAWQGVSYAEDASSLLDAVSWSPKRSLRDLFNRVNGTYIAPNSPYNTAGNLYDANGWYYGTTSNLWPLSWQPTNYPQYACDKLHGYASDTYLAEDGGLVLPKELTLRGVISIVQAQRLAKIELMRNRFQGTGTLKMSLAAWRMVPTSIMQYTWSAMGWTNKLLEISRLQFVCESTKDSNGEEGAPALSLSVSVNETDPSIYEWDLSEELTPYDVEACPAAIPTTPAEPTAVSLENDSTTATMLSNGTTMSRLLVSWTAPVDPYVTQNGSIQIQYAGLLEAGSTSSVATTALTTPITLNGVTLTKQTVWVDAGSVSGNATYKYIDSVSAYVAMTVQIRAVYANGTASDWVQDSLGAASIPLIVNTPESLLSIVSGSNVLTTSSKSTVIADLNALAANYASNVAAANAVNVSTTSYTNAYNALTAYLATLTSPVLWSDLSSYTTIDSTTFAADLQVVYTVQAALLAEITAAAQTTANTANTTANDASTAASEAVDTANTASTTATNASNTATSTQTNLNQINSVNYLTNSDKIALMAQWSAELATQTSLDASATTWSTSSTYYDNAVTAISTALINSGAPLNWATTWPDGFTSGPWDDIQTRLSNLWAQVATQRTALQSSISAEQAAAAKSTAISTSATDTLTKLNTMGLSSPYTATWSSGSKPALPNTTYPAGSCWVATDGAEFQVNADGTEWQAVVVAASGLFGKLVASQLTITNATNLIPNPDCSITNPAAGSFEAAALQNWGAAYPGVIGSVLLPNGWGRAIHVPSVGGNVWYRMNKISCTVGDVFTAKCQACWNNGGGSGMLGISFFKADDTTVGNFYSAQGITSASVDTPSELSLTATAPAGTAYAMAFIQVMGTTLVDTYATFNNFLMRQCSDASVLIDGCVTAAKADLSLLDAAVAHIKKLDCDDVDIINLHADNITGTLSAHKVIFDDGSALTTASRVQQTVNADQGYMSLTNDYATLPGTSVSVTVVSTADVINVFSTISIPCSGKVGVGVQLVVDGVVQNNHQLYIFSNFDIPYITSLQGLSAGTHSLSIQASADGSVTARCKVIYQRIF